MLAVLVVTLNNMFNKADVYIYFKFRIIFNLLDRLKQVKSL